MREKRFTDDTLAKTIGISRATFFRKLRSKGETFTVKEVEGICNSLGLNKNEVHGIFFEK